MRPPPHFLAVKSRSHRPENREPCWAPASGSASSHPGWKAAQPSQDQGRHPMPCCLLHEGSHRDFNPRVLRSARKQSLSINRDQMRPGQHFPLVPASVDMATCTPLSVQAGVHCVPQMCMLGCMDMGVYVHMSTTLICTRGCVPHRTAFAHLCSHTLEACAPDNEHARLPAVCAGARTCACT